MIDLQDIGKYRENNRIEAKKAAGGFPNSLWETYSAFANTIGGLILLGVEESRSKRLRVTGVPDAAEYERIFWRIVRDPRRVSANILTPEDVTVQTVDGRNAIIIAVPQAIRRHRPVYLDGNPFTGTYRRDGEGDYHCTEEEVRNMLRDRDDAPRDLTVLDTLSLENLSLNTLREFRLLMAMRSPEHPWNYLPDKEFLPAAGAAAPGRDGHSLHPTVAGLLLLGTFPTLTQTFPGYQLVYREDDSEFSIYSGDSGWSGNLFDFYSQVSRRLTASAARYPKTVPSGELASALREAALNALLHTDYFGGQGLEILRCTDFLRVTNSGLLRVPLENARKGGTADPRNTVLTRLFSLAGIGSGKGKGLKSIYDIWAQQGWSAPILTESFRPDTTRISLPLGDRSNSPSDLLRQQVAEYLTDHISASTEELSAALHQTPVKIQVCLIQLFMDGLVIRREENGKKIWLLRA